MTNHMKHDEQMFQGTVAGLRKQLDPPPPCLSRLAGRVLNGQSKFLPNSPSIPSPEGSPPYLPAGHRYPAAVPMVVLLGGSCWAYLGLLDGIFRLLGLLVCHL